MNKFTDAIHEVMSEFSEDDAQYQRNIVCLRFFHALNPNLNPDTINDRPEFNELCGLVQKITEMGE